MNNIFNDKRGFMAIVALGVFALLIIFGLIVQLTVVDTYGSVKDTNNYYAARDISDSVMEYLQWELNKHDVGYSTGNITCAYGDYATNEGGGQPSICQEFDWVDDQAGVTDVKIAYSIKGRAEVGEKIETTKCGSGLFGSFNNDCYVVPFPGTGDAGKNCNLYEPSFNEQVGATAIVPLNLSNGVSNLDQADYSCNWNRLTFGGSTTDRVAIPLYYEKGLDQAGAPILVNPFKDKSATQLLFRLRTPCLPCVYGDTEKTPDQTRHCENGADTTVCTNDERYELDVLTDDKVVVQWQLSGKCEDEAGGEKDCSVLPIAGNDKSAIFESVINDSKDKETYKIIENKTIGNDVSVHPVKIVSFLEDDLIVKSKLPPITQPILNIFLSNSLISNVKKNVPYLEYQLLTNKPMGSPKVKLEAEVTVNGNTFKKTLYKEIKKDLVDFAIQN